MKPARKGIANTNAQTIGGVLSDGAILSEAKIGKLIVGETCRESFVKPASYDVTAAPDGMIVPSGEEIPAGRGRGPKRVVLQPGDTAMFSTRELFSLPETIAGNITIKNSLAIEGLLLLSGGLVDPGYGHEKRAPKQAGDRLYLHVANIGKQAIEIRPESDPIARIQFLTVCGPIKVPRKTIPPSSWSDQKRPSLGFLSELKELKENVERSDVRSKAVVQFGVVVVAIALIGASFSAILSIVTNSTLSKELHNVWPASSRDGVVWAMVFLGTVLAVLTVVLATDKICRVLDRRRRRKRRLQ